MSSFNRRQFLESTALLGVAGSLFPSEFPSRHTSASYAESIRTGSITVEAIEKAERVAGLKFTPEQRELMLEGLIDRLDNFQALRDLQIPNEVAPCQFFDPELGLSITPKLDHRPDIAWTPVDVAVPASDEDLAFSSVADLSSLLKSRKITSLDLTELYLSRLKKYDTVLEAVVTYTERRAYRLARKADEELDSGYCRGPLHGIPWGAKDLLSTKGYPTTWGAAAYKDQVIDYDAAVVTRLDEAGAVLIAKLSLGALAMGDVWFDGKTKNPWNIERGSSGSSAGPGSTVAAGLVGFAIGSETLGSIVSPAARNGVTGFRPTFGRVSRAGAMTLSWTMDKLGPMCRSAQDCALVFSAIHGMDEADPTSVTTNFEWPVGRSIDGLSVGYLKNRFETSYDNQDADKAVLDVLRDLGAELMPIELPSVPEKAILLMLSAEAAFDHLTLSGGTDALVRQDPGAWPNSFRKSRFIPAVEYINASRARTLLIRELKTVLEDVDVFVSPSFGGSTLSITNLTGHPSVTVPNRFAPIEDDPESGRRNPFSVTFIGGLFKDAEMLSVAHAFQSVTDFHLRRPPIS
ncbi:MAG: amidase [Rhodothermia bacterium]|nr:MAG: amidase [Rhodothermia bacterium]